jgi:hypothetical protein
MFESGVGHRLAAAGLVQWKYDRAAQFFKQFERCDPYLRIKLVDIAGNK